MLVGLLYYFYHKFDNTEVYAKIISFILSSYLRVLVGKGPFCLSVLPFQVQVLKIQREYSSHSVQSTLDLTQNVFFKDSDDQEHWIPFFAVALSMELPF